MYDLILNEPKYNGFIKIRGALTNTRSAWTITWSIPSHLYRIPFTGKNDSKQFLINELQMKEKGCNKKTEAKAFDLFTNQIIPFYSPLIIHWI